MEKQAVLYQVDAFAEQPFQGNPAGVCLLNQPVPDDWMQKLAMEMNLAETAFVLMQGETINLRWFTPTVEVELCGHATLASAHVLWESGLIQIDQEIAFTTRFHGALLCRQSEQGIEMNFPAVPPQACENPPQFSASIQEHSRNVCKTQYDYLVEVESEAAVRSAKPDLEKIAQIASRGLILTSTAETEGIDFVSRFFAPAAGVPEDPVTGSAHCTLGPYWQKRLNRDNLLGYQCSQRGGKVATRMEDDRVWLGGKAVTVFSAQLSNEAMLGS